MKSWPQCPCGQEPTYFRYGEKGSSKLANILTLCDLCAALARLAGETFGVDWQDWEPTKYWRVVGDGIDSRGDRAEWESRCSRISE